MIVPPALVSFGPVVRSCDVPIKVAVSVMAAPAWAFVDVVTMVGSALNFPGLMQEGEVLASTPPAVRNEFLRFFLALSCFLWVDFRM